MVNDFTRQVSDPYKQFNSYNPSLLLQQSNAVAVNTADTLCMDDEPVTELHQMKVRDIATAHALVCKVV